MTVLVPFLVPATHEIALAVIQHAPLPVLHVHDWPHADTADALRPLAEHPTDTPEGTFLVVVDGVVVGDCGWFGPPEDGLVDIGYGLAPSVRRQGLGTQVVRLLLAWVATRGAVRARAEVLPGNEASLRLLNGLGFTVTGERAGHRVLICEVGHKS